MNSPIVPHQEEEIGVGAKVDEVTEEDHIETRVGKKNLLMIDADVPVEERIEDLKKTSGLAFCEVACQGYRVTCPPGRGSKPQMKKNMGDFENPSALKFYFETFIDRKFKRELEGDYDTESPLIIISGENGDTYSKYVDVIDNLKREHPNVPLVMLACNSANKRYSVKEAGRSVVVFKKYAITAEGREIVAGDGADGYPIGCKGFNTQEYIDSSDEFGCFNTKKNKRKKHGAGTIYKIFGLRVLVPSNGDKPVEDTNNDFVSYEKCNDNCKEKMYPLIKNEIEKPDQTMCSVSTNPEYFKRMTVDEILADIKKKESKNDGKHVLIAY